MALAPVLRAAPPPGLPLETFFGAVADGIWPIRSARPHRSAEVLEQRLKKAGKNYLNIVIENEGHGFQKLENRVRFYTEMDAFLKEHLLTPRAGRVEIRPAQVIELPARPKS